MSKEPLLSICMPVYNEGRYIKKSLQALLEQDYRDFELIISDNASTDETSQLCKEWAKLDSRIKYNKSDNNIGVFANTKKALANAKGRYIMLASGHDLWSKGLLRECIELLESDSSIAVTYGHCQWIDESGEVIDNKTWIYDTRGLDIANRFYYVLLGSMNPILGIVRAEFLPPIGSITQLIGWDLVLLLRLSLKGDFACARNSLFSRRQPREIEDYATKLGRYKNGEYNLVSAPIDKKNPLLRLPLTIALLVLRSSLDSVTKGAIFLSLPSLFYLKYKFGVKK